MRHSKALIWFAAILLCVSISAVALAGSTGPLAELWKSGCDFLFHTDNVTVTGEASFSLDGEHFKTAQLQYVQDGYSSYYGLKLLTPRKEGGERETGWTIIADGEGNYYVMEAYYPGIYRPGTGSACNTLLRRSIQLDALTELGGFLVGQLEPMLPEGTVTVEEADGARTVHIAVAGDQIPDMAVSALNVAAGYLSDRWFSYSHDRSVVEDECTPYENYVTATYALTDGTVRWTLREADVDFTLDDQGRLTAVRGNVRAASTFWDQSVREVAVRFELAATDYGTSRVKAFDPADYNVTLPREYYGENTEGEELALDEDAWNEWMNLAMELISAQGYAISPEASLGGWCENNVIKIDIENPEGNEYFCVFSQDGRLLTLENLTADWPFADQVDAENVDEDTIAAAEKLMRSFMAEQNPALADSVEELVLQSMIVTEDGSRYLTFDDAELNMVHFVIRVEPELRIEYYIGASNG